MYDDDAVLERLRDHALPTSLKSVGDAHPPLSRC